MSTGPEIARAILRARRGPRAKPPPETAPVPCAWCGAAAYRPCHLGAPMHDFPLPRIHDVRRRALQIVEETRP